MTLFYQGLLLVCGLFSFRQAQASPKVLFLGDSWAAWPFARRSDFQTACPDADVAVEGKGGSIAPEWLGEKYGSHLDQVVNVKHTDAASVWISLGGNDLFRSDCLTPVSDIAADVEAVVRIVATALPEANILLTGYTKSFPKAPGQLIPISLCTQPQFDSFYLELASIATNFEKVTYVEPQSIVRLMWFDSIHLKWSGYQSMWAEPAIKAVICPVPPTAPTPPPPSPCFSELTTVQLKNVDVPVPIKDINIGDSVLTKSGSFKPVYAWGHFDSKGSAVFLQIHTTGKGGPLEITGKHMIFVEGRAGPVRADAVIVGDTLVDNAGKRDRKDVKISKVRRTGLYSPFTADGTIVVNGDIAASTYIDPHNTAGDEYMKVGSIALPLMKATLYHIWLSPLRMLCMGVSAHICEYCDEEGISLWAATGLALVKFADQHESFFSQLVIYGLMIIVPAFCMVIEFFVGPSLGPLIILLGAAIAFKLKKKASANVSMATIRTKVA